MPRSVRRSKKPANIRKTYRRAVIALTMRRATDLVFCRRNGSTTHQITLQKADDGASNKGATVSPRLRPMTKHSPPNNTPY